MKFITEDDLRDLYKKVPFTTYEIEPLVKLTPGARQFLADRGIPILVNAVKPIDVQKNKKNWKVLKLHRRMQSMQALFLITEEELLKDDVISAGHVSKLGKQFSNIIDALDKKIIPDEFTCQECSGINNDIVYDDLEDCFEISEFHMQLEKGKTIIILHRLRCELREIEPILLETMEECKEESELYEETIRKINQISNMLSQMICIAVGGTKCQRKS